MKKDKKIIAFDVGDRWIGVAHANLSLGMVFPYQTWEVYECIKKLTDYAFEYDLKTVVVGLPLTLKGNESQQTEKVKSWVDQMRQAFPDIVFIFEDERLSSTFANNLSIHYNNKQKHSNHAIAAAIILEHYIKKSID
jgi:putative Holliday junction resolvase